MIWTRRGEDSSGLRNTGPGKETKENKSKAKCHNFGKKSIQKEQEGGTRLFSNCLPNERRERGRWGSNKGTKVSYSRGR